MSKILWIAWWRVRLVAGSPRRFFLLFILPVFFIAAVNVPFSANSAGGRTILVVDDDRTWLSQQLIENLEKRSGLVVLEGSLRDARRMIARRQAVNAYRILPGFQAALLQGEVPQLEKWSTRMPMNNLPFVSVTAQVGRLLAVTGATQEVARQVGLPVAEGAPSPQWQGIFQKLLVKAQAPLPEMQFLSKGGEFIKVRQVAGFSDGPFGMLLTFIALLLGYGLTMLLRERQLGVSDRVILAAGQSFQRFGNALGLGFVLLGQVLVALLTWLLLIREGFAASFLVLLLICLFFGVMMTGVVLFLAKKAFLSAETLQNIYAPVVVLLSLMGGCFVSGELLPRGLQYLTWFSPQGIAMNAYRAFAAGEYLTIALAALLTVVVSAVTLRR